MNMITAKSLTLPTVNSKQAKEIHAKLQQDRQKRNVKPSENSTGELSSTTAQIVVPVEINHLEIEASINIPNENNDTQNISSYFICFKLCKWARCFSSS